VPECAGATAGWRRDPSSDRHRHRLTTFAFAEALVVSSVAWGCPQLGALRTTLETIGALHNLEREGPLGITEAAGVTWLLPTSPQGPRELRHARRPHTVEEEKARPTRLLLVAGRRLAGAGPDVRVSSDSALRPVVRTAPGLASKR
jgi:hypothetical protein